MEYLYLSTANAIMTPGSGAKKPENKHFYRYNVCDFALPMSTITK